MSFFDLKRRLQSGGGIDSMAPPPLTPLAVAADLRWQLKLYRVDRLPALTIVAFLALRVLHLIQYHRGWSRGARDV